MGSGQHMTVAYYRSTANGRMSTGAHECHLPRELIRKGFLAIDDAINWCILNTISVRQSTLAGGIFLKRKICLQNGTSFGKSQLMNGVKLANQNKNKLAGNFKITS